MAVRGSPAASHVQRISWKPQRPPGELTKDEEIKYLYEVIAWYDQRNGYYIGMTEVMREAIDSTPGASEKFVELIERREAVEELLNVRKHLVPPNKGNP